jgi:hypothetical protein
MCCSLACTIPSFRKAGLKLVLDWESEEEKSYEPVYKGEISTDAAALFFNISYEQACFLFISGTNYDTVMSKNFQGPKSNITPKQEAKRIEKFVTSDGVIPELENSK